MSFDENNLFEIFFYPAVRDRRILNRLASMEEKKGKDNLQKQIERLCRFRDMSIRYAGVNQKRRRHSYNWSGDASLL